MDTINHHLETIRKLAVELKKVENLNEMADAYKNRTSELEEIASKLLNSVDECISNSNELLKDNKDAIECYRINNQTLVSKIGDDFYIINEKLKCFDDLSKGLVTVNNNVIFLRRRLEEKVMLVDSICTKSLKYIKVGTLVLIAIVLIQIFTTIYILWIK